MGYFSNFGNFYACWSVYFLFVFWIVMIVDAAQKKFKTDGDKVVWILVLIFLSFLGAIIYYFIIKRKDNDNNRRKRRK